MQIVATVAINCNKETPYLSCIQIEINFLKEIFDYVYEIGTYWEIFNYMYETIFF